MLSSDSDARRIWINTEQKLQLFVGAALLFSENTAAYLNISAALLSRASNLSEQNRADLNNIAGVSSH